MPLKAVIFDFGGVLVRTHGQELRRQWEQRLGLQRGQAEHIIFGGEKEWAVQLGRMSDAEHWQWLGTRFGLEQAAAEELRRDFFATDAVDEELLAYVDRLRAAGYHVAILSNASRGARQMFGASYGLVDHFDSITISAEEGVMKPDPAIFEIALKRAGVAPAEAVFVDDVPANVEAARRLGLNSLLFVDFVTLHQDLLNLTGID